MHKKVVIKIKAHGGAYNLTAPRHFGRGNCCCIASTEATSRVKVHAGGAKPVRDVLDGLEQMYDDLFGED